MKCYQNPEVCYRKESHPLHPDGQTEHSLFQMYFQLTGAYQKNLNRWDPDSQQKQKLQTTSNCQQRRDTEEDQ